MNKINFNKIKTTLVFDKGVSNLEEFLDEYNLFDEFKQEYKQSYNDFENKELNKRRDELLIIEELAEKYLNTDTERYKVIQNEVSYSYEIYIIVLSKRED